MSVGPALRCLAMVLAAWLASIASASVSRADPPDHPAADPATDPAADADDTCEGLPPRNRLARYDLLGDGAVHAVTRAGDHFLVYPQQADGCEVYPLAAAVVRVEGRFSIGSHAMALRSRRCGGGSCPIAIAIRGKTARPILALRPALDCDTSLELHLLKLFPSRDTLELVCRNSAGAGWHETRAILDTTDDAVVTLLSLDTGSYIALSPDEQRTGACPSYPVGSLRVEKLGAVPVVRLIDPASAPLDDGKGVIPARQLAYDPAQHAFVPTGAPDLPTRVDAHRCHR